MADGFAGYDLWLSTERAPEHPDPPDPIEEREQTIESLESEIAQLHRYIEELEVENAALKGDLR